MTDKKSPSMLLNESANPFDLGCMKTRLLEGAAINVLIGRDWHNLKTTELRLFDLLADFGLIEAKSGYVQLVKPKDNHHD